MATNSNIRRIDRQVEEEEVIDLLELAKALWSKASILIVAFVIGATVAALISISFITPQYEASSMIYVYSKTTSITSLADLQVGSQLTVDFQIIAKTRPVIESSLAEIGLNRSYESVVDSVSVTNPNNSRILTITVRDSDPQVACALSNAIAGQLRHRIADVMNTDEPSIVEEALVPLHPVSPSVVKNAFIGGFGLFAIVAAIIIVAFILDDTIKTEEDVEKYLNQNVLAVVPLVNSKKRNHARNASSKKKSAAVGK